MNSQERLIFFEILRSALWEHEADLSIFEGEWDWRNILRAFQNHSLLGVVAEKIMDLPVQFQPNKKQGTSLLKYYAVTLMDHRRLNRAIAEVFQKLQDRGCEPILLKGQGLASLYPNPCCRACGDIDIYVGPKDYDAAKEVVNAMAAPDSISRAQSGELKHHYSININKITYEVHRFPGVAGNDLKQKVYEEYSLKVLVPANTTEIRLQSPTGETVVLVPNQEVNAWYVFNHLLQHYRGSGIGLRQFCDWMMAMKAWSKEGSSFRFPETLDLLGLTRAWKILSGILVHQLGFPKDQMPLYDEKMAMKSQGFILDHIVEGRNFRFGLMPRRYLEPNYFLRLRNMLHVYYTTSKATFVILRTYPFRKYWRDVKNGAVKITKELWGKV